MNLRRQIYQHSAQNNKNEFENQLYDDFIDEIKDLISLSELLLEDYKNNPSEQLLIKYKSKLNLIKGQALSVNEDIVSRLTNIIVSLSKKPHAPFFYEKNKAYLDFLNQYVQRHSAQVKLGYFMVFLRELTRDDS